MRLKEYEKMTKVISWSNQDKPYPKRGEVLTNTFNEKFKVVSVRKTSDGADITLDTF
jgi:hypothetical protein